MTVSTGRRAANFIPAPLRIASLTYALLLGQCVLPPASWADKAPSRDPIDLGAASKARVATLLSGPGVEAMLILSEPSTPLHSEPALIPKSMGSVLFD
jgi:hypothetical protein